MLSLMQDSVMSLLNQSASAKHAFDLDAEPEPIPEDADDDGGYDAMGDDNDDNDHGEFNFSLVQPSF